MKTKNVILLVSGLVLGYFLSKMNWGKKTSVGIGQVLNGVEDTVTPLVSDTTKAINKATSTTECEQKWNEKVGAVTRFISSEARNQSKLDYVKNCMPSN